MVIVTGTVIFYCCLYILSLASFVFPGLTCRIYAGSSNLFGVYCMRQRKDVLMLWLECAQLHFLAGGMPVVNYHMASLGGQK